MKAELGRYRMRGFSMFKKIPHWDELIFLPGTLTRFVIEGYREKCETKTVLGARFAKKPIELDIPVYITGMSFGALSLEAKMALAKGASMAGTATCSGEGGMIPPERDLSTKWYYQIIQSRYGFNPHHLMLADAVEFFIGQGCKVGLGGHLMGQKVTEQVAEMRSLPAGIDQRSPARHPDWLGPDDLSLKIQETREATNYEIPIQLKLGAARVYDDVRMAAKCGPDIIYLDGAEGGTGRRAAHRGRGDRHPADVRDPRGAPRARGRRAWPTRSTSSWPAASATAATWPSASRSAPTPMAIGHSALMALNCNKEIPGVTDYEGTDRRAGRPVLPLPHGPLPGRDHHPGPGAAQAPARRGGRQPRLQLPAHAHARGADARARVREDQRALAGARGPGGADDRGRGDGPRAARRHRATSRACPRSGRSARSRRCSTATSRTRSTTCPKTASIRRGPSPRPPQTEPASDERAAEDLRDRRRVPLGAALSVPGGHRAGRGRRPRGGHARPGHQLARGRGAARGGGHARRLRPLLELLPQDLLPDPGGARERDRPQGADHAPPVGQLLRHPPEGEALQVPPAGAGALGGGLADGGRATGGRRCSRAGSRRFTECDAVRQAPRHRRGSARALHGLAPRRAGRGGAGGGQDRRGRRRLRHRLRRGPQQLLPARDAGADGGLRGDLGVGPGDLRLPRLAATSRSATAPRRATSPPSTSASSGSATSRR